MYSSAQRFYMGNHKELPNKMTYSSFLKELFEISKQLGECYFPITYDTMKQENYCQIDIANTKQSIEKQVFDYYPIWAYYNLQHITECSPFLDFYQLLIAGAEEGGHRGQGEILRLLVNGVEPLGTPENV